MDNELNVTSAIINVEIPKVIIYWITILLIALIFILTFSVFYQYPKFLNYQGNVIKEDDKYLIKILVKEDEVLKIKNSKLLIEQKEVKHEVYYINPLYSLDIQNQKYYEVLIKCNLDKSLQYDNLPIHVKFQLTNTTLMKEAINKIKKGWM